MSLLKPFILNVYRKAAGSYVSGRWTNGSASPDFTIQTSWQPANGRDLQALEEGMRQSSIFKGYPKIKVQTVNPETLEKEDIIVGPDGSNYRVIFVAPYQNNLINHYKFMAMREKEGT